MLTRKWKIKELTKKYIYILKKKPEINFDGKPLVYCLLLSLDIG